MAVWFSSALNVGSEEIFGALSLIFSILTVIASVVMLSPSEAEILKTYWVADS